MIDLTPRLFVISAVEALELCNQPADTAEITKIADYARKTAVTVL